MAQSDLQQQFRLRLSSCANLADLAAGKTPPYLDLPPPSRRLFCGSPLFSHRIQAPKPTAATSATRALPPVRAPQSMQQTWTTAQHDGPDRLGVWLESGGNPRWLAPELCGERAAEEPQETESERLARLFGPLPARATKEMACA